MNWDDYSALVNAYLFLAEIGANILWVIYHHLRNSSDDKIKIRYLLLLESIVAITVYIIAYGFEAEGIIEIIEFIILSSLMGIMLGYCANILVYLGIRILWFIKGEK